MVVACWLLLIFGCKNGSNSSNNTSTYATGNVINAFIEIPAGSNAKNENFLPYPGNYGYIPSTSMNPEQGGNGKPVNILVLSERVEANTLLEVVPIALFRTENPPKLNATVIAVPKDPSKQSFKVKDFKTFSKEFVKARIIIEYWLTSYTGKSIEGSIHWQDEKAAYREINRWKVKKEDE